MSIKMVSAKLAATAAGIALLQGGAVRMAEPMNTDTPRFTTNADGKLVETSPEYVKQPRYVKTERVRELPPLPEPERRRRIVERTIECQPIPGPYGVAGSLPAGATRAYIDEAECPPIAQVAYAPAPLPRFRRSVAAAALAVAR